MSLEELLNQESKQVLPVQATKPIDTSVVQPKKEKPKFMGVKTTLFTDPNTGVPHAIPVSMSPMPTVDRILTYVERTGFCGILCIGQSGTGKSTLARFLVHQIHMRKAFVVHWYQRNDIQKLDKEIHALEKGVPAILIFDDASFALDQLKKEQINRIAQALTYVRHDVRAPVIVIMNIHYSKAISRFFRNVPFAFLTSISQEEVQSFTDTWPHGRWKFKDYALYYQQMMFNSQWTFQIDRWNRRTYTYKTDEPFRLGLAMEGNMIHFFVYLRHGCPICDPGYSIKKFANSQDVVDHYVKSYGLERARSMLRMYAFARHGLKVIDKNRYAIWRSISNFDTNNRINWKDSMAYLESLGKKRRRVYVKHSVIDKDTQEMKSVRESTEEQEKEFRLELEQQLLDLEQNRHLTDPEREEVPNMGFDPETQSPMDMPYGFKEDNPGQPVQDDGIAGDASSDADIQQDT